uniref:Rho GTPase activating protein 25 n=1 Tax=Cynoglossus semilaevis TaxID=244447 RepID=A0A3P8VS22_CYNSE
MSLKLPRNWDFSTFKAETSRIASSKSVMPGVGGTTQGPPCFSKSMEKPVKAGWLKKQRSLVKNWQLRYFVLRGSTLTYHKDGSTIDRERCPNVFMANSQSDMEEWVRTLRRVVGVLSYISAVIGKSLLDTVTYEQRFGPCMVPILVQKCVEFIKAHGLDEEGIFRLPGQDNTIKQFRDAFDAGERPSFPSDTDVHTVASLLKLYLRELPEPVVPWTQYQDFLDCTNMLDCSSTELEKQISLLPRINYNLLSYVCRFLFEVQRHSAVNKMTVENLATVMGINLLKPQIEDPITVMKATPHIQKLMTVMIRQHEVLFPPSKDLLPSPPSKKAESKKSTPRSFVGWESEEDIDSPATERGTWIPQTPRASLFSPTGDDWHESPRKRTQTLPTFTCPLIGMPAKADAISRWSHIQECSEEKSGGTLSEDIFKILDLKDSGGSLFGGTHVSNKKEQVSTSRRGSEDTGSSITSPQKTVGESQHCPLTSSQKSVEKVKRSDQQVNSQPEMKQDDQLSVNSLQQENKELKATVAELQSALEAQRRRASALEICLRNAECSRDEAQRRNEELQRDVQQFLNTKPQAPT